MPKAADATFAHSGSDEKNSALDNMLLRSAVKYLLGR
jgi:hypothetical protein